MSFNVSLFFCCFLCVFCCCFFFVCFFVCLFVFLVLFCLFFLVFFFLLWLPFCSAKQNHFRNFSRGSLEEHFCANILKSGQMSFEDFLFVALAAILFNGVEPLQPSWNSDQQNFSSFWSRSHPVALEQVSTESDQRFGKRCRKLVYKMAAVAAILDFLLDHLAILFLLGALMLIIVFIQLEMSKI